LRFALDEAFKIAAIFEEQGVGVVFRMALQENEEALAVFDEGIDAAVVKAGEDFVAGGLKFAGRKIVPTGMGDVKARENAGVQEMSIDPRALENAELLFGKAAAGDPVKMKDGGVGGETGPNRRKGVLRSPIQELSDVRPVRFLLEVGGTWFRAGDNKSIERPVPEVADITIANQAAASLVPGRKSWKRIECQAQGEFVGRRLMEEGDELTFGGFHGRVRHVVHEANIEDGLHDFFTARRA